MGWLLAFRETSTFLVFGEAHLRHLFGELVAHYHQERPHQSLQNEPLCGLPDPPAEQALLPLSAVRCRERLGGFLRHYHCGAA